LLEGSRKEELRGENIWVIEILSAIGDSTKKKSSARGGERDRLLTGGNEAWGESGTSRQLAYASTELAIVVVVSGQKKRIEFRAVLNTPLKDLGRKRKLNTPWKASFNPREPRLGCKKRSERMARR